MTQSGWNLRPLVFLFVRQTVNGVKRAIRDPRRLVGLLFFAFYMAVGPFRNMFLGRTANQSERGLNRVSEEALKGLPSEISKHPEAFMNAVVFAGMATVIYFSVISLLSYRGSFKPADVDVLFPTPVSPKLVLLTRILKDSLASMLLPLFFYAISIGNGFDPKSLTGTAGFESVGLVTRLGFLAYLLVALAFVAFGYGTSLFFNRQEANVDVQRRIVGWSIALFGLGGVVYVAFGLYRTFGVESFVALMSPVWLRTVLFPAELATLVAMSPIQGGLRNFGIGIAGLVGFIWLGVAYALRQSKWLYEIGAIRATTMSELMETSKKGHTYAAMAARAKRGKFRAKSFQWVKRWKPRGLMGLVWKDLTLQIRAGLTLNTILPVFVVGLLLALPTIIQLTSGSPVSSRAQERIFYMPWGVAHVILIFTAFGAAQGAFNEFLKRTDVLKPLPFSSSSIAWAEILSKAIPTLLPVIVTFLMILATYPYEFLAVTGGLIFTATASLFAVSLVCLIVMFFPDIEDPAQAAFRSLVQLFLFAAGMAIPVTLYIVPMVALKWNPLAASLLPSMIFAVAAFVCAVIAGRLYMNFNPKE